MSGVTKKQSSGWERYVVRWMQWSGLLAAFLVVLVYAGVSDADPGKVARWELWKGKAVFWITGDYRPRMEFFQNRDFKPHEDNVSPAVAKDQVFVIHRARVTFGADILDRLKVVLQVQDVRKWGSETDTLDFSAEGLDVHQAFAEVRLVDQFFVKLGRMELIYDNHRLIGNLDWAQQARAFDGILLKYEPKAFQLHALYAHLQEAGAVEDDSHLAMLWFRLRKFPFFQPSLYYVFDHNAPTNRLRHTFGTHINGAVSGFQYSGEFFMQLGSQGKDNAAQDIFAYMLAVSAGYTLPVNTKPTFILFAEFLSGDSDLTDKTVRVFDTLFATNHKFYGYVDLFLNIPVHTGGRGLMDLGLTFKITPVKNLTLMATFHYFRLFTPTKDAGGQEVQELGPEIDITAQYSLLKGHLLLSGGYGVLIPMAAFQAMGKGKYAENWAYLEMHARF